MQGLATPGRYSQCFTPKAGGATWRPIAPRVGADDEGDRMGVTYRSMTSKAARQPIIESYIKAAVQLRGRKAYLVMCPHCGAENQLTGTVEQKGRKTHKKVALTAMGHALQKERYDGSSIRIAHCNACHVDVIPLAYDNPYAYLVDALPPEILRRFVPDFDVDD